MMKKIYNYLKFLCLISIIFIGFVYAKEANISIKSIDIYEVSDTTIEQTKPSTEGYSISSPITFYDKDDYIKYKLVIKNNDDEDYTIYEVKDDNKNKYLKYEYEIENNKLKAKGESIIYVKVTYNKELDGNIELTPEDSYNDTNKINISFTLKDKAGEIISSINPKTSDNILKYIIISIISLSIIIFILLKYKNKKSILFISIITIITLPVITLADSMFDSKLVFNNDINYNFSFLSSGWKDKITGDFTKIEITKTKDIPDEAVDISKLENGSVKGWIKDGTLYIGGHHRTYSPVNSSNLFAIGTSSAPSNITNIDFKDNFRTNFVQNMSYMFQFNNGLTSLDVKSFDTNNVTNFYYMFAGCNNLEKLNIGGFNFSDYNILGTLMSNLGLVSSIKKIDMTRAKFPKNSNNAFGGYSELEELILDDVDTSSVRNMMQMFRATFSLKELNLSSFDTSNVTDMNAMFYYIGYNSTELKQVDLSSFDTSNVTDMRNMFNNCRNLEKIDLSKFNTSNVTDMSSMFSGCKNLKELNLSGFNFAKYNPGSLMMNMTGGGLASLKKINMTRAKLPQNLNYAFGGLATAEEIVLTNVDTSSVTTMQAMFYGDSSLKELDLSSFDTSNVTDMNAMFNGDSSLKKLDLSNFDTSNVTNMASMFNGCNNLEELNLSNWNFSKATTKGYMFSGCTSLEKLVMDNYDLTAFDLNSSVFSGLSSLKTMSCKNWKIPENYTHWLGRRWGMSMVETVDVTGWNLSETKDITGLFADSSSLKEIKGLNTWNTSNITNMSTMFYDNSSLKKLDLSSFDTSNVTDMRNMFYGNSSLKKLDLSSFDTSNVTNMASMFGRCSNLEELNLSGFDFVKYNPGSLMMNMTGGGLASLKKINMTRAKLPQNLNYAFGGLATAEEIVLTNVDTSSVTTMQAMFNGDSSLKELDLSSFDTSNVTEMNSMFQSDSSLKELDLSSFDTSNVTIMSAMFLGCSSLKTLDLSNFNTSNVTNMSSMFNSNNSLEELNLSGFDFTKYNSGGLMIIITGGGLPSIKKLNMTRAKLPSNLQYAFGGLPTLEEIVLDDVDTSSSTNMSAMFNGDSSLKKLDLSNFDTSNVTNLDGMFGGCSNLEKLNLSSFSTSNVTNMYGLFINTSNLEKIYVSDNFVTTKLTEEDSSKDMFKGAVKLVGGAGTVYDAEHIDKEYAHIDGGTSNPGYFSSK